METKRALITGITGQDGSYLAELLISKGYEVFGIIRRASLFNTSRVEHLFKEIHEKDIRLRMEFGDLCDGSSVNKLIRKYRLDEVYNLGAQSHVRVSFDIPEYTVDTTALGTLRLLESLKDFSPNTKFYQAGSSEMFGKVQEIPQRETTPFYPRSPYGCAKVFSHFITKNYREAYGLFACNGILFNHESERRGETFVTRKITRALTRIKLGLQPKLYLGNMDAKRDWGHAKDFVEAMWLMMQKDIPEDYVIGTGETHTVREFLEKSAEHAGLVIHSNGQTGENEKYLDEKGNIIIEIDPRYYRPTEVDILIADSSKAKKELNWSPKISFNELIKRMVDNDLNLAEKEAHIKDHFKD